MRYWRLCLGTKIEYGYIMGRNNEKVKISNNEDNAIFGQGVRMSIER